MTIASKIAKRPEQLHDHPESMREAIAVDVAYTFKAAFEKKKTEKGKEKVALKLLKFCNELASRDLVLAGAVVTVVYSDHWNFRHIVKMARKHRKDPSVGPFLRTLKRVCLTGPRESRNSLTRDCEIKAAIWAGDTLEQINARLTRYDLTA